jgi:uncharacterized membrane protein
MLVHFPIVFWTVAVVAYLASASGITGPIDTLARSANGAGLIMAMLAMIAGFMELRTIDRSSDAMRVATWHMMIMATVWICFLLALILPISTGPDLPTGYLVIACAVAGFLLMGIGGWFGGRLVYEFGIAVKNRTKS